eukprot:CAMPEP_0179303672 /NCGR_PEP_ID=MMETSP0797-20121207/48698_1 /TAXON_ID=47934 /ORGANISM="Dinophysis acuminata, Strain DAEP01" /LENGTH=284 /DNA_ID=CAMNT_0021013235 /DNA_START=70 /DNA_END=921 /DNA_ORIENTATION=+
MPIFSTAEKRADVKNSNTECWGDGAFWTGAPPGTQPHAAASMSLPLTFVVIHPSSGPRPPTFWNFSLSAALATSLILAPVAILSGSSADDNSHPRRTSRPPLSAPPTTVHILAALSALFCSGSASFGGACGASLAAGAPTSVLGASAALVAGSSAAAVLGSGAGSGSAAAASPLSAASGCAAGTCAGTSSAFGAGATSGAGASVGPGCLISDTVVGGMGDLFCSSASSSTSGTVASLLKECGLPAYSHLRSPMPQHPFNDELPILSRPTGTPTLRPKEALPWAK